MRAPVISLRHFTKNDVPIIAGQIYPGLDSRETEVMIDEWNSCVYDGHYFEMFAIDADDRVVGYASVNERSKSVVSLGVDILRSERLKGYATSAMNKIIEVVREKGYRLIIDQVESDNEASKALHTAMGFETDGYIFKNQRGHSVILFIKIID